jgi:hypothetical protein
VRGLVRACAGSAWLSGRRSGNDDPSTASGTSTVAKPYAPYPAAPLVFRPGFTYNPQTTPLNPRFSPTTFIRCDEPLHRFFSFRRAADERYSLN